VVEQHAIVGKISSLPHDCSNQVGMTFPHCIHVSVRFGTMTQSLQQKANAVVASSIVHPIRKKCTMTAPTKRATRSFARVTKARAGLRGPLVVAIKPALEHEPLVTQH
jgi:hypothetical protein